MATFNKQNLKLRTVNEGDPRQPCNEDQLGFPPVFQSSHHALWWLRRERGRLLQAEEVKGDGNFHAEAGGSRRRSKPAESLPLRYMVMIVRGVTLKSAPWSALWPNLLALLAFSVILFGFSAWRFRKQ